MPATSEETDSLTVVADAGNSLKGTMVIASEAAGRSPQNINLPDQHASSSTENVHASDNQHLTPGKKYKRHINPKTPRSQIAISKIPHASTNGDSAFKSGKIKVTTNANYPTPSTSMPQPAIGTSIGNYPFGGQGLNHISQYNCNSNPSNRVSGFCILTIPDALTLCNSDPNCGGFDVTTNVDWHNAYDVNGQTVVQLFTAGAPTNPTTEWSFYSKPAEICV
ncbi:unnamed protein product [Rotaria socialis]|uniref:Uncharacterized protein n=4 Tax=Rotaria socialis TaxID=392032 RepID=A0A817YMY1_9BILA|nr:unnamed protein product [Rotaria socialis]CAF3549464.1 unnamed protein product [Rotaria socialis]